MSGFLYYICVFFYIVKVFFFVVFSVGLLGVDLYEFLLYVDICYLVVFIFLD